jgi:hypothetical protein
MYLLSPQLEVPEIGSKLTQGSFPRILQFRFSQGEYRLWEKEKQLRFVLRKTADDLNVFPLNWAMSQLHVSKHPKVQRLGRNGSEEGTMLSVRSSGSIR